MLVLSFFLFRVLPGDPAAPLGRGRFTTEEQLDAFSRTYGLDQPLPQQFLTFLRNTATGDLGISLRYRVPVSELLVDRMWPTLLLVGTSTVLAAVIGVWLGVRGAWKRGGPFDKVSTGASLTLYSMPEWWLGMMLIALLAVGIGPLPGCSRPVGCTRSTPIPARSAGRWTPLAPLPAGADAHLAYLADYALIMRSSLLDELGEDSYPDDGAREGPARHRRAQPARRAQRAAAHHHGGRAEHRLRGHRGHHHRDGVLDPRLGLLATEALSVPDYWVLQGTFLVASACVILASLANLLYGCWTHGWT